MNQEKIGKFIAKNRKDKGLTQEALAEKLGISTNAVSKWEEDFLFQMYLYLKSYVVNLI